MKRFFLLLGLVLSLLMLSMTPVLATEEETEGDSDTESSTSVAMPEIDAKAAILIDASTGRVLYAKNEHESLPMASTTKILTALIALESIDDFSRTVTLPDDFMNVGESSIYLEPGETHTYEDLFYALLLRSANDAAQAIAIGVSGSEEAFVEEMNAKTKELGLKDSHWANPHGLDAEDHYTSAYDLAMIAREDVKYDFFNEVIKTESWTMPWAENDYDRTLYNHNQFLDLYEGGDGIKTGYTDDAGNCLVASATRNGLRLIGVVLNCSEHYTAMSQMMDYGFANYQAVTAGQAGDKVGTARIIDGNVKTLDLVLAADAVLAFAQDADLESLGEGTPDIPAALEAPVTAGTEVGTMTYTDDAGNELVIPVLAENGAERYTFRTVFQEAWSIFMQVFLGKK